MIAIIDYGVPVSLKQLGLEAVTADADTIRKRSTLPCHGQARQDQRFILLWADKSCPLRWIPRWMQAAHIAPAQCPTSSVVWW